MKNLPRQSFAASSQSHRRKRDFAALRFDYAKHQTASATFANAKTTRRQAAGSSPATFFIEAIKNTTQGSSLRFDATLREVRYGWDSSKDTELVRQGMRVAGDGVQEVEVWLFISED
jgi:hypothetical protein